MNIKERNIAAYKEYYKDQINYGESPESDPNYCAYSQTSAFHMLGKLTDLKNVRLSDGTVLVSCPEALRVYGANRLLWHVVGNPLSVAAWLEQKCDCSQRLPRATMPIGQRYDLTLYVFKDGSAVGLDGDKLYIFLTREVNALTARMRACPKGTVPGGVQVPEPVARLIESGQLTREDYPAFFAGWCDAGGAPRALTGLGEIKRVGNPGYIRIDRIDAYWLGRKTYLNDCRPPRKA